MSIVITGNPGVGKHTIAQEIAQRMKLDVCDINRVAKDAGLYERDGDTHDVDTKKLGDILKQTVLDRDVIVGHLAPHALSEEQVKVIVVLRRSPYDLVGEYEDRGYSQEKTMENAASEILGVITHETIEKFGDKTFQVDVTKKSISDVANMVMEAVAGKGIDEQVDWLELVKTNDDLAKFFVD